MGSRCIESKVAMTKVFPGPALSEDQWQQISSLATTLSPEQATWISGYFSGVSDSFRLRTGSATAVVEKVPPAATLAPAVASRTLTVLYASETGNSAALAKAFAQDAKAQGINASVASMAGFCCASCATRLFPVRAHAPATEYKICRVSTTTYH